MTYQRFEELPVWQGAQGMFVEVCRLTGRRDFPRRADLRDQVERAALSVGNNIAEGFERGTTEELLTFLYIARGSVGEVRSCLLAVKALQEQEVERVGAETLAMVGPLIAQAESISRQLRGWAQSLQEGDIRGQRRLTEESKQEYGRTRRAQAFRRTLEEKQKQAVQRWVRGDEERRESEI